MLLKFKLKNYKSYGKSQEFKTIPSAYKRMKNHVVEEKNYNSLRVNAIFGGNASGKSNLVSAINYVKNVVRRGKVTKYLDDITFKMNEDKVVNFETEIGISDDVFIYGISVDTMRAKVLQEYLYVVNHSNDEMPVFDLDYSLAKFETNSKYLSKQNSQRTRIYLDDIKSGELFIKKLSDAKEYNEDLFYKYANDVYNWFSKKLTIIRPNSKPINIMGQFTNQNNDSQYVSVIELVKSFDTGITDYEKYEMTFDEFKKEVFVELPEKSLQDIENQLLNMPVGMNVDWNIGNKYYKLSHKNEKTGIVVEKLGFKHCFNNKTIFNYNEESDGTRRLIELANVLFAIQKEQRIFIIDELNRSLHPNLTEEFINRFLILSAKTKSQLIFTTHETNIMNQKILRQDEIWLIDRDKNGNSNLVPLSDFKIRYDKIIDKDYLKGRYSGIPVIEKIISTGEQDE